MTSREARLREAAEELIDGEQVIAVGEFMPKSVADGFFIGAALGAHIGQSLGSLPAGAGVGAVTGAVLGDGRTTLPRYVGLAVTPEHVHLLGIPHEFFHKQPEDAYLIATLERDDLEVHVKARIGDHLATITDTANEVTLQLTADGISGHYSKTVLELLRLGAQHHDGADDDASAIQPS